MEWKSVFRNPLCALSVLAMFAGLLVDFQGAASKMARAIPLIEALLPLIALGGVTFFGLWSIWAVPSFFWARRPAAKFGTNYYFIVKCRNAVEGRIIGILDNNSHLYAGMTELSNTLSRFRIQCPNINPDDKYYAVVWFNFLAQLAPLARHDDLYNARKLGLRGNESHDRTQL